VDAARTIQGFLVGRGVTFFRHGKCRRNFQFPNLLGFLIVLSGEIGAFLES
jgi:hypothetical protein